MSARLAAAAPLRAFPVLGWGGDQYWNALRGGGQVIPTQRPHDADLLLCLGELPEAWRPQLHKLYETLALPRLPLWIGDAGADGGTAALPGVLRLAPNDLDRRERWQAVRAAHRDLSRANNRQSLEDRPPRPWRGVGPHGQGGEGMMGGAPYGRPMAMTADDPDQLALDDLPTALGPFFPGLPTGLRIDVQVQGDRVRSVNRLHNLFPPRVVDRPGDAGPTLAPSVAAMAGQPVTVRALETVRIRAHLSWAADLLSLVGLEALSRRFARAAAAAALSPAAVERLFARAARSALGRLTRGIGRIDLGAAERLGLVGPVARASGVRRDARLEDAAYRMAGFAGSFEAAGDVWARWCVHRSECRESFALIARAGDRRVLAAEAPAGQMRRRGRGRLAGASAANLAALEAGLPGLEWFEAVLFVASLGLDMREAALR